jgi:hypothetical protein
MLPTPQPQATTTPCRSVPGAQPGPWPAKPQQQQHAAPAAAPASSQAQGTIPCQNSRARVQLSALLASPAGVYVTPRWLGVLLRSLGRAHTLCLKVCTHGSHGSLSWVSCRCCGTEQGDLCGPGLPDWCWFLILSLWASKLWDPCSQTRECLRGTVLTLFQLQTVAGSAATASRSHRVVPVLHCT